MIGQNKRGFPQKQVNNLSGKNIQMLEPEITERKVWELKHAGLALGAAFGFIVLQFLFMTLFSLGVVGSWVSAFILLAIYAIGIYFLLEPKVIREIKQPILETKIETVEKPVFRDVVRTVEVEKPVVKTVNREVIREIEKPILITEKKVKRAPSIRYNFVGSDLTKVYHKNTCRLSKSIKKKYRLSSNNEEFFKRRKYKPCDVCVRKIKKV